MQYKPSKFPQTPNKTRTRINHGGSDDGDIYHPCTWTTSLWHWAAWVTNGGPKVNEAVGTFDLQRPEPDGDHAQS